MIPLKINNKNLCEIFEPGKDFSGYTDDEISSYSIEHSMYPTEVKLSSEQYSRDAERTADYELEKLVIVNTKAKPEFTWSLIKAIYVYQLMKFLNFKYDYKNTDGEVVPEEAEVINVTYWDLIGTRTIKSYMGQTIEGTLVEYDGVLYWENFRIAFPER